MTTTNVMGIVAGIGMFTSTTFYKVFNNGDRHGDCVTFFQGWGLAIVVSTIVWIILHKLFNVKETDTFKGL